MELDARIDLIGVDCLQAFITVDHEGFPLIELLTAFDLLLQPVPGWLFNLYCGLSLRRRILMVVKGRFGLLVGYIRSAIDSSLLIRDGQWLGVS